MAQEPLDEYVQRAYAAGLSSSDISLQLAQVGWGEEQIAVALQKTSIDASTSSITPAPHAPTNSKLATYTTWITCLIIIRLLLIPFQYVLVSLILTHDFFNSAYALNFNTFSNSLPLLWLIPLGLFRKKDRNAYVLSIIFASVLMFLNIFGLASFESQPAFWFVSFIYVLSGAAIAALSILSLRLLPKKVEAQTNQVIAVRPSGVKMWEIILGAIFGLAAILPAFSGLSSSMGDLMDNDMGNPFFPFAVSLALGAALGWLCAKGFAFSISKKQRTFMLGKGLWYGGLLGAVAQVPLYGFSAILLIAMPIGAMIGAVIGLFASVLVGYLMEKSIVAR